MVRRNEELGYAVSLITQGDWRFYTLTMQSEILANCCYVSSRFEDPKEGFQRRLDRKRALEIAEYIDSGLGTIPNAVILSAQEAANLTVTGRGKTIRFRYNPHAFLVLDGQHRVYGYSLAKTSLRIPVVIYNDLTRAEEVKLFIDINTKQRPVPNELLLDIKRLASYETTDEKLLGELFDEFNSSPDSIMLGLLSASERSRGKISRVTFYTAVRPTLNRFNVRERDAIYPTLNQYLTAVIQHLNDKEIGDAITGTVLFKAILDLFPRVARIVIDRTDSDYTDADFYEALEPIFRNARRTTFQKPGTSYKTLSAKLLRRLDAEPLI